MRPEQDGTRGRAGVRPRTSRQIEQTDRAGGSDRHRQGRGHAAVGRKDASGVSSRESEPVRGTDAGRHASGGAHDHRSALAEPEDDDLFAPESFGADAYGSDAVGSESYDDHPGFLLDGDDAHDVPADPSDHRPAPGRRPTRAGVRDASRRRRRRRALLLAAAVLVAVVGASAWLVGVPVYRYFNPADYSGSGTGSVVVTVHANDGASQIGTTLQKAGVVASQRAFVDQAKNNSKSQNMQPGSYTPAPAHVGGQRAGPDALAGRRG